MGNDSYTGAPAPDLDPPIIVLPGSAPGAAVFDGEALRRADELRWSLSAVATYRPAHERRDTLADAHETALRLVDATGADAAPATAPPSPLTPAQEYFRTRTGALDDGAYLAQTAKLLADTLAEISDAPLAGPDIERLCCALDRHLLDLGASGPPRPAQPALAHSPGSVLADEQRWMRRWIVAHQVHALFNVSAAGWVENATAAASRSDWVRAEQCLGAATTYVEAFSPSRALALAVPAAFYNEVLRATMTPPLTSTPLIGKMHVVYRAYRDAVDALLSELSEPVAVLVRTHPSLALARERLLEADLADADRHIALIEPVVGGAKSIVQTARTQGNALSALRAIRAARARTVAPYVRFSEPATAPPGTEAPGS